MSRLIIFLVEVCDYFLWKQSYRRASWSYKWNVILLWEAIMSHSHPFQGSVLRLEVVLSWRLYPSFCGLSFPYRWPFNSAVQCKNSTQHCLDAVIMATVETSGPETQKWLYSMNAKQRMHYWWRKLTTKCSLNLHIQQPECLPGLPVKIKYCQSDQFLIHHWLCVSHCRRGKWGKPRISGGHLSQDLG